MYAYKHIHIFIYIYIKVVSDEVYGGSVFGDGAEFHSLWDQALEGLVSLTFIVQLDFIQRWNGIGTPDPNPRNVDLVNWCF